MYSLWLAFVALLCVAGARSAPQSNAERLARGLTPLRPQFRSIKPGLPPSPALAAKRNFPSNTPIQTFYSGRIEVRSSSGAVLGYVKNQPLSTPIDGINLGPSDQELHVQFTVPQSTGVLTVVEPFPILASNPKFLSPYYIGIAFGQSVVPLVPGVANSLIFTNVYQTPTGPPQQTARGPSESNIWTINRSTKQLIPRYINPDGSKPNTEIAYDPPNNRIFFVESVSTWKNVHPGTLTHAVSFFLADIPS
ncbi:hypothetical protein HGRIS_010383 [Hohenbuehelia grisea]|uniref:Uncharacterized protein n=1 Tax=Hohenbuehelia grisea TaxID=104357 RepID=A0ABR3J458_9AGAR